LKRFEQTQSLLKTYNYPPFPYVMMKTGTYSQGKFKFEIINPTKKTGNLTISGTFRPSEIATSINFNETINLNGLPKNLNLL